LHRSDRFSRSIQEPGQALTQQRLKIRLLGYSRHVDVPINSAFFATGNNLEIGNDLTRRTLLCQLDAGMERPELRSFKSNVLEAARTDRGRLVAAVLTILRAWHLARTTIGVEPLGSFEDWSSRIRSPILWLGREDPCDSISTVRESNPYRSVFQTPCLCNGNRYSGRQAATPFNKSFSARLSIRTSSERLLQSPCLHKAEVSAMTGLDAG
jgi:hypothetical protein